MGGGIEYSAAAADASTGVDADVYGLELDGQLGGGGMNDSLGHDSSAYEVRGSYDDI